MKSSVTMMDVARAAGVSKATVSNAFNRPELLVPALRERVEKAAREVGYAGPDPKGRVLSSGRVHALGVVLPGMLGISNALENPYVRRFLSGVASLCTEKGIALTIISGADGTRQCGAETALVDGFILHGVEQVESMAPALRRKLPVVVIDYDAGPEVSSVRAEDRAGGWLAARHMLQLGHRRIAIVSTMYDDRPSQLHGPGKKDRRLEAPFLFTTSSRIAGISDALYAAGLSIDDVPIVEASGSTRDEVLAREGVAMLLDAAPSATGIICLAGHLGMAVLDEARRRGIAVPSALSVISFGGSPDEKRTSPPLTVVQTPVFEKGRAAARIALEGGPKQHLVLPFGLVIRGSTAAPLPWLPVP
ncbi:MAG TPA: LacI family DNA-binding transcriptional regulator [Amaricoccus sp.]|uniref:LacI family DNA-binding transcriptional regulator n=1 Tax=Amaricoccus sp. TaxID=1872485 RepID=UPI002C3F7237|nr:LacI family DNA-binding transcriptional regulator [Amaricoccus sp.]HPG21541.1 LacI family DNA-binding transcriptional regulator [Amaricoccus sp.]HRW15934.1 LacI family DNA-binding transcriptional regulator [Amaricoccus sp.]